MNGHILYEIFIETKIIRLWIRPKKFEQILSFHFQCFFTRFTFVREKWTNIKNVTIKHFISFLIFHIFFKRWHLLRFILSILLSYIHSKQSWNCSYLVLFFSEISSQLCKSFIFLLQKWNIKSAYFLINLQNWQAWIFWREKKDGKLKVL